MLKTINSYLKENDVDAWIIYDYKSSNPAFKELFGNKFLTRKCYVILYKNKKNKILCHEVDKLSFSDVDLKKYEIQTYTNWENMVLKLSLLLNNNDKVLMEISENGLLPNISFIDYGTVMLIKSMVKEIKTSADLFQIVTAKLSKESIVLHKQAAKILEIIKNNAFDYIFFKTKENQCVTEYEVQQFILQQFKIYNLITVEPPIVAISQNAANPHYVPSINSSSYIKKNELFIIDLWGKFKLEKSVYADISWVGYNGNKVDFEYEKIFKILSDAVEITLEFLRQELPKREVSGYEVDDICRDFVKKNGFGDYFIHRTGHNLSKGLNVHGVGVNIDNFETHDSRKIVDSIAFSIEPGIYIPNKLGIRKEINVLIKNREPIVTTSMQTHIIENKFL